MQKDLKKISSNHVSVFVFTFLYWTWASLDEGKTCCCRLIPPPADKNSCFKCDLTGGHLLLLLKPKTVFAVTAECLYFEYLTTRVKM